MTFLEAAYGTSLHPVTVVSRCSLNATIWTVFARPWTFATLDPAVATCRRPVIEKTSSTAIREGACRSHARARDRGIHGIHEVEESCPNPLVLTAQTFAASLNVLKALMGGAGESRDVTPGKYSWSSKLRAVLPVRRAQGSSSSSDHVVLLRNTTGRERRPALRQQDVLLGLGPIGPSVEATTKMPPSIWAAQVIMSSRSRR